MLLALVLQAYIFLFEQLNRVHEGSDFVIMDLAECLDLFVGSIAHRLIPVQLFALLGQLFFQKTDT